MVKASAFLALEASLALRMATSLTRVATRAYKDVQAAIDAEQWGEAEVTLRKLSLDSVFTENEDYIRYMSRVAALFGASRVSRSPGTSAVGLGFENTAIQQWVESFRLAIQHNLQERLIDSGLHLIALVRERGAPTPEKLSIAVKEDSEYLGSVLKAAKNSALLPFASFMNKEGAALFNIASSLHTSRLSAFGYTAEAEYLGITTYQINEQLDGRTCPVCAYMHQKTFKVSDARALLDTVIRTQDPDELKSMQPWPSQSAQSIRDLQSLTSEELVSRGWHVPPFHPRCRGLLSQSGTVPTLVPGKTPPTKIEKYVSTKEDFLQLGINLSTAKVNTWNTLIQTSPAELIANLKGTTTDKLLAELQGVKNPQDYLGLANLSVTKNAVNLELQTSAFGSKSPVKQDYYFRKDQGLYVGLIEVDDADSGVVRKVLRSLYNSARGTTMKSIQMVADDQISGYAWAKYGFTMNARQWGLVKKQIANSSLKASQIKAASEIEQKAIAAILESPDPKSVFALSDLKMGKELLADTTWAGTFELDDPESVTRFLTAIGK